MLPGLLRFASTGELPIMLTRESMIGSTINFFMIVNKKKVLKKETYDPLFYI
jgi:hypothetical protein